MKSKIISLIMVTLLLFTFVSCKKEVKVTSIEVIQETIPESILLPEVNDVLKQIKIKVNKSNKETEEVTLSNSMISEEDFAKLATHGNHQIKVKYEGFETAITLNIIDNYIVKVVYPDGSPVKDSVFVQWCKGDMCYIPVMINENGYANIELEDGEYYIHLVEDSIPSKYTYNPNIYVTSTNNKYVEVKLIALSNFTSGEGTKEVPYLVNTGCYELSFDQASVTGIKYFSFTATASGEVTISSMAIDKLAQNAVDPYVSFLGTTNDIAGRDISGNKENDINFNYKFNAEEGVTYYFTVHVSSADSFPAEFCIEIK